MTSNLKYAALILYMIVAVPIVLAIVICLRILHATLEIYEDVSLSLSNPSSTILYKWMKW